MKARIAFWTALIIIPVNFAVQDLKAQDKTKEQEQAELKIKQEIEQQKLDMQEQQKSIREAPQGPELLAPEDYPEATQISRYMDYMNSRITGNQYNNQPDRFAPGRTSWDFSKSVTESSFSKEYGIDVEKGSKSVSLNISGTCKSGEIRVSIIMPDGKLYSEAVIDEFGNLNWRKSFQIAEDNTDKIGEWKFRINAKGATGNFNISLQVN